MKKLFLILGVVMLLSLVFVSAPTTHAAFDATCTASPNSIGPWQRTIVSCTGFTPNTHVWAYYVDPAGAASALCVTTPLDISMPVETFAPAAPQFGAIICDLKTNEKGQVAFFFSNRFYPYYFRDSANPAATFPVWNLNFATLKLGEWTFVVEELVPDGGGAKAHQGKATVQVTGGTEGVAGALLAASPSTVYKPWEAYTSEHLSAPSISLNLTMPNYTPMLLAGTGFKPGEIVSIWVDQPNGGCSNFTMHRERYYDLYLQEINVAVPNGQPPSIDIQLDNQLNLPLLNGIATFRVADVKADETGSFKGYFQFFASDCEGKWHFVARGNSSKLGGDVYITLIGNPTAESALLGVSPSTASAIGARLWFAGAGFKAGEHVSCWLTSPQGQVVGVPTPGLLSGHVEGFVPANNPNGDSGVYFSFDFGDKGIKADGNGNFSFSMFTGSVYDHLNLKVTMTGVVQGSNNPNGNGTTTLAGSMELWDPLFSEGALGQWSMSCRGDESGLTGVTRFTLTGGPNDP